MPIYVRAGAIILFDPIRQYTSRPVTGLTTLKIYPGANGSFILYEDDGISLDYLKGKATLTRFTWDDKRKKLQITPANSGSIKNRKFRVELVPGNAVKTVLYTGKPVDIAF